jgi:FlaG/FlaF family flagellin (archaellin)
MEKNNAVSPVIGVLLMLTLTLIIAAIVNSYAGGLVETENKAPAATLQVSYHQELTENALEIRHISGDSIPTSSVKLMIRPSETFGNGATTQLTPIDKSYITNISDSSLTWDSGISVFRPGDIAGISRDHLNSMQGSVQQQYWLANSSNAGKTFFLEMYYQKSLISKNEVLIE